MSIPRLKGLSSRSLLASACLIAAGGCVYAFTGGGGLPGHIDSIAIVPFENRTTQFTLTQELTQALTGIVPARLGVNIANEVTADAVMRGTITRFANTATNFQAEEGGPVIFQRRVTITVAVEIYDLKEEQTIWEAGTVSAEGEYLPDSQPEEEGRKLAIENLTQKIIDGAQSQW